MESVLEVDNSPLLMTDDGNVIVPMSVFHSITKKDYDDVWAVTAVKYLPAFTPRAIDRRSGQVDLNHACSKNNKTNRKAMVTIVSEDIFGSTSNPYIRNAYDDYIHHLYSREKGEHEKGDYPFELDGRVPKSSADLLDAFFDEDGPGMKLAREGKWDRLCAWYYIVTYWATSETHDGQWVVEGLNLYYKSKGWRISLDCSHLGRKNKSVHPLVRIAKKKAFDAMKSSFRLKMGRMYGRTMDLQANMTGPLDTDQRLVDIGEYLPSVVKSKMTRIHKFQFRMKLWSEKKVHDLEMSITMSVQGVAKAAMKGGMKKSDLEELVGGVIGEMYDGENVDGDESEMSTEDETETVRRSPRRSKVRRKNTKELKTSLARKLTKMTANEERSEKRGTKRGGTSVDDALMAAGHVNVEINWEIGSKFGCYHCSKAFSKSEECVFVFCEKCHEWKMKKIAEKRGGNETNNSTTTAGRRRGSRGRAAGGVEEVNVCENLKRGVCGHHTWGDLKHLSFETDKSWTWREQSKKLKDTGCMAKHCYGCGLIL